MSEFVIWHNINCSKSNAAKNLLDEKKLECNIRNYLENPPSFDELKDVLKKLNMSAFQLIRSGETIYKSLNLQNIKDEDELIKIMIENPILIERPIIINENKAVIARPIEKLSDFINEF